MTELSKFCKILKLLHEKSSSGKIVYDVICGPEKLRRASAAINHYIADQKIIDAGKNSYNLETLMKCIQEAINQWHESNPKEKIPESLRIRFTWDGRKISWGNVGFFFVPLHELFPSQNCWRRNWKVKDLVSLLQKK